MDLTGLFISAAVLLYVGMTIYVANLGDMQRLRWFLYGIIAGKVFIGLNLVLLATAGGEALAGAPMPEISTSAAFANFALVVVAAAISSAFVTSPAARLSLRRILPASADYNPESPVHLAGVVLSLAFLVLNTTQFVLGGGLGGLADMIEATGVALDEVLFVGLLWVLAALLSVGFGIRRTMEQTLARLSLRWPTSTDLRAGILTGGLLYAGSIVVAMIWALFVSPETFAEQTAAAQRLGQAINSLPLLLVVSLWAPIGEEVFFRGAMQPVFGIVPTSLFFALIHTQYALTPASVWIVVVAIVLGFLRERTSTTATIVAHFVYNFVPLALLLLTSSSMVG
ncbi:MAG: CPBP family intramembrane glutamic endopeptidase [Chloroflexota bacterium]|nr:MAG: hypothetical protein DIU68_18925 [Chloroflexota bacterium]